MKLRAQTFFMIFFLVIGVAVTIYIIQSYGLAQIINFYQHMSDQTLVLYLIVICAIFAVLTWRWDVILRSRGYRIPFYKLYVYRLIGSAINFFTPGPRVGGEPTQAALLAKYNIEFTEGLSTIMIDKIIDMTSSGLLFIIGAVIVSFQFPIPESAKIYMVIGAVLFLAITILFYYQMLTSRHFFLKIFHFFRLDRSTRPSIRKLEEGIMRVETIMMQFYKHDKGRFLLSVFITAVSWILMFCEYKIATTLLGLNLDFVQLFFIITFIGIAILFPIPMAVGVLEASQISAFNMIGITATGGVALAFLVRMKDLFFGIIGMIFLAMFGFNVPKTIEEKYKKKLAK